MSKIVVLSYLPIYPTNGGGRVRIRALAANLARHHEVTVICPPLEETPSEPFGFTVCDDTVRGARQLFDPRVYRTILNRVREVRPDYILAEYIWQSAHANISRLAHHVPVILDAFDVVTERFRKAGSRIWPLIGILERYALKTADRVFAVSNVDRRQLVRLGAPASRTSVVPNGVDTTRFRPNAEAGIRIRGELGITKDERLLFFFGQLNYAPNIKAVQTLLGEVMPRLGPEYRLAIAGRGSIKQFDRIQRDGRSTFLGPVDALPDYINAADAVVAPIMQGSGTRLKLLEGIACGAPTVATSKAAEGIDRTACEPSLIVADGWDDFSSAIQKATTMERITPSHLFYDTYDWKAIVERIRL